MRRRESLGKCLFITSDIPDVRTGLHGARGLVVHAYLGPRDLRSHGVITYYLAGLSE